VSTRRRQSDLVRDLLDKQLLDRHGRMMGKVDGIVLELREGEPPRVAWIEVGVPTLLARIHPALARFHRWLARRLGPRLVRTARVPIETLRDVGVDAEVDVDAARSGALRWEHWFRDRVVKHIPGGQR
jgi:hypothetical protein